MTVTTLAKPSTTRRLATLTGIVALYLRVSTVEQAEEGVSLDAQEAELRRLADERWPDSPILVFREEGKSAREGKARPVYDALRERVEHGQVEAIIAVERSRLARSVTEWLSLRKLCAERRTHLETINGGIEDLSTAAGRFMGTILAAVAEFESDLKSERVSRAVKYLLDNGRSHGPVPFGLSRAANGTRETNEHFPAVVAAFRLIDGGASVKHTARVLTETSGKKMSEARLRDRILRNPTFAGLTDYDGRLVETHEPFLARDLWHRVQAILDGNAEKAARHPRKNPFGSLVRCGACGGRMELHPNNKHAVLRCENRRHKKCSAATLPTEDFAFTVLNAFTGAYTDLSANLEDSTWTWYIDDEETRHERDAGLAAVSTDLAELETRSDRLYDAFESGSIDREKYQTRAAELRERRNALEVQRDELGRDTTTHRADLEALRDRLGGDCGDDVPPALRPHVRWLEASFEERVELLRSIVRQIVVEHDSYVSVTFRPGPALTFQTSQRRNARSALLRSLGYGLWHKQTRAPPCAPFFRRHAAAAPRMSARPPKKGNPLGEWHVIDPYPPPSNEQFPQR